MLDLPIGVAVMCPSVPFLPYCPDTSNGLPAIGPISPLPFLPLQSQLP